MATPARLIEGGTRPVARARFSPLKLMPAAFPWHETGHRTVSAKLLFAGEHRLDAHAYLSSGFGVRLSIEEKAAGWRCLGELADISQPPRLKGILVCPEFGTPYLNTSQAFAIRPAPRKWLSLDRTPKAGDRISKAGTILVMASANPGKCMLTTTAHEGHVISHHFVRLEAKMPEDKGWIYAWLKSPSARKIMLGSQYASIIKHLEIHHFRALPVPEVSAGWREWFNSALAEILRMRNAAHARTLEAERVFEEAVTPLRPGDDGESGFTVRASAFLSGRRRLDSLPHNPATRSIYKHLGKHGQGFSTVSELGFDVWLPCRFRRIPAEDGVPFMDSSDLFEINPDVTKRIADGNFGDRSNGRVKAGWLLLARSGQIYGINGSLMLAGKALEDSVISDHVIRVAPNAAQQTRAGYLLIALSHPSLGRPLVKSLPYGSSIPEIEVADFAEMKVVRLPKETEDQIADLAEEAAALRSEADILEDRMAAEADRLIEAFIAGQNLAAIPAPAGLEGKIASAGSGVYSPPETTEPMTGIEKTPGVNGGDACIARTRIPVWVLEEMRRAGATEAEILADFPGITSSQLHQAWVYVKQYSAEIESALLAHAGA